MLTVLLLVCAAMALTNAAVVPEAAANETEEAFAQEDDDHTVQRSSVCPSNGSQYNGRCFFYVPAPMTWAYAEKHCQTLGGNLASVHSFNEYEVIQSMIHRNIDTYPVTWLGGLDAQQEGVWLWIDGSPFNFFNWGPGQPDNLNNGQHCLTMNWGDGKQWDDDWCAASFPFVCARKILSS